MHRDLVFNYPPNVEALGSSPSCQVQGMYIPDSVITVQGHPEFNGEIVAELLGNRHRLGIFGDDIYEEAIRRVKEKQDGVLVGQAFLRFLGVKEVD